MVELAGYGARLPAQLSGGQQQRVALARVLATDPRVLLFDEPLSALDKNLRDTLKYSILDLQRRTGKTAIYVTHDQSEAFAISDRIVVMNAGRVEQIGTQTDIYLHPADARSWPSSSAPTTGCAGTVTGVERRAATAPRDGRSSGRAARCAEPSRAGARSRRSRWSPTSGRRTSSSSTTAMRRLRERRRGRRSTGSSSRAPTAQLRVDVGGREMRVDVSGNRAADADAPRRPGPARLRRGDPHPGARVRHRLAGS